MDHFSYLKHDPMNVFYSSNTPIGLYARQKWLHQEDTLTWKNDFRETVDELFSGQLPNGSWDDSLLTTAHRLFGLHLTSKIHAMNGSKKHSNGSCHRRSF